MSSNAVICDLRHKFSYNGWILLIYYGIMNVSCLIAMTFEALIYWIRSSLNPEPEQTEFIQTILDRSLENGWGYVLACVIGGIILFVWKQYDFCFHQLWTRKRRMSPKTFVVLVCAFLSGHAIQLFLTPIVEMFGFSTETLLRSAGTDSTTVCMFLYVAIFAPVFEEILFRGLVLENLLPYGKKFAIITSSILFGLFHGNMIQTPFAIVVGLVLGYAAVEFGLIWSIILHVFNNLVLGEITTLFVKLFPMLHIDLVVCGLTFCCAIFTLVLAAVKWRNIADFFCKNRIESIYLKSFFSAKGIIAFVAVMLLHMISYLFL